MTVIIGIVCFVAGLMCGVFMMCLVTVGKSRRLSYYENKYKSYEISDENGDAGAKEV